MKNKVIADIFEANPHRTYKTLERRTLKLSEEVGEASQAILSITSPANLKKLTKEDYLEEVTDVIIVAMDIMLTNFEGEELTPEELEQRFEQILDKKLTKWREKIEQLGEMGEAALAQGTTC